MLVHFSREQDAYRGQLDQVWRFLALSGKNGEVPVSDADCQIEGILSVALHSVELLDERDHRLSILW